MVRFKKWFKKILLVSGLLFSAGIVHATDVAYSGVFPGVEGLATGVITSSTKTYTRDMNTTGDRVSVQIVASTYTLAASQTFTDGTQSTGSITVSSVTYIQASTPTIKINGVTISYTPASTSTGTALSISSGIINNASLKLIVSSTWTAGGVVYATSTINGSAQNFSMFTASQAALGVSGATMTGGTNSAYVINTPTITISSNNFITGLPVKFSTGTVAISGLTNQTTYFVSVINPNNSGISSMFKLSLTSTGSVAGVGIVLASSQTHTTADTFTLAPINFSNTGGGIQLQWSDDDVTFFSGTTGNYNATISSVTFAAAGNSALYDLGPIQHRYLRFNVLPPTAGAANYTVTDNERYSFKH